MLPAHLHSDMTIDEAAATSALLASNRDVARARVTYGFGSMAHKRAVGVYRALLAYLRGAHAERDAQGARV